MTIEEEIKKSTEQLYDIIAQSNSLEEAYQSLVDWYGSDNPQILETLRYYEEIKISQKHRTTPLYKLL